jgi:hypothetical protein
MNEKRYGFMETGVQELKESTWVGRKRILPPVRWLGNAFFYAAIKR